MERWFLHQRREPTGSKIASRRGSKPTLFLARGPSLAWRQTPDRKIPGERESSFLRSFPMESRNYIYSAGLWYVPERPMGTHALEANFLRIITDLALALILQQLLVRGPLELAVIASGS